MPLCMYAQDLPSAEGQLDKTYGYIKSHELLALKIQQNYPELAPRIERATTLLYQNFGPGLRKMDQEIQNKYRNEYPELSKKLIKLGGSTFTSVTKVEAEKFLHRYEQMSVGRIKSPHLEVLLDEQFSSLPMLQYYRHYNQRYSVANYSKDVLTEVQLKIPNNWSEQMTKGQEAVLKKFRSSLGEGSIILNLVKAYKTKNSHKTELESLLSELVPKKAIIQESIKKSMGNQFVYFVNYSDQRAELNHAFKRNVSLYIIEQAGDYYILDFSIYALNEDTNSLTTDIQRLFDQIVSTVQISKRPYKKSLVSNKH